MGGESPERALIAVTPFTGGILSIFDLVGDVGSGFSAPRLRKVSHLLFRPSAADLTQYIIRKRLCRN